MLSRRMGQGSPLREGLILAPHRPCQMMAPHGS
eukprot:CAMPEP_0195078060 /NCGR_PEP_ID=MMETSP0448-20130528/20345_1 /TAXON_ID=66468 /ORGANISM="Heterocapsa triquestra, Strain CCMP 448" /LENGTH=32 /DNA_ID= /DNA_START= /DNA_END= /DNA_ORIENTATION=